MFFAVDGGAVGAINLLPSALIPSGAVILGATSRVTTAVTSGGAATTTSAAVRDSCSSSHAAVFTSTKRSIRAIPLSVDWARLQGHVGASIAAPPKS